MTTKPAMQKVLKGILHIKEDKCNQENTGKSKFHQLSRLVKED
jgi:hypothetical protein